MDDTSTIPKRHHIGLLVMEDPTSDPNALQGLELVT